MGEPVNPYGLAFLAGLAGLIALGASWAANQGPQGRDDSDVRFQVELQRQIDRQDREIQELRSMLESQAAELQEQDREIQSLGEAVDLPT